MDRWTDRQSSSMHFAPLWGGSIIIAIFNKIKVKTEANWKLSIFMSANRAIHNNMEQNGIYLQ